MDPRWTLVSSACLSSSKANVLGEGLVVFSLLMLYFSILHFGFFFFFWPIKRWHKISTWGRRTLAKLDFAPQPLEITLQGNERVLQKNAQKSPEGGFSTLVLGYIVLCATVFAYFNSLDPSKQTINQAPAPWAGINVPNGEVPKFSVLMGAVLSASCSDSAPTVTTSTPNAQISDVVCIDPSCQTFSTSSCLSQSTVFWTVQMSQSSQTQILSPVVQVTVNNYHSIGKVFASGAVYNVLQATKSSNDQSNNGVFSSFQTGGFSYFPRKIEAASVTNSAQTFLFQTASSCFSVGWGFENGTSVLWTPDLAVATVGGSLSSSTVESFRFSVPQITVPSNPGYSSATTISLQVVWNGQVWNVATNFAGLFQFATIFLSVIGSSLALHPRLRSVFQFFTVLYARKQWFRITFRWLLLFDAFCWMGMLIIFGAILGLQEAFSILPTSEGWSVGVMITMMVLCGLNFLAVCFWHGTEKRQGFCCSWCCQRCLPQPESGISDGHWASSYGAINLPSTAASEEQPLTTSHAIENAKSYAKIV